MERPLSQEDLIAQLDGWVGAEVAIRVVTGDGELLAVVQGRLAERARGKEPALFWRLARATEDPHAESPGVYLRPERFEGASVHQGEFVLEVRQAGATLNIRRL